MPNVGGEGGAKKEKKNHHPLNTLHALPAHSRGPPRLTLTRAQLQLADRTQGGRDRFPLPLMLSPRNNMEGHAFASALSSACRSGRRPRCMEPVPLAATVLTLALLSMISMRAGSDGLFAQGFRRQCGVQTCTEASFLPSVVIEQLAEIQSLGRARLAAALAGNYPPADAPFSSPFADVTITLPLPVALANPSDGQGQDAKYFSGPLALKNRGSNCVVYAAGLDRQHRFESAMVALGCTVHGFDCTVPEARSDWDFTFHDWCIGVPQSFEGNHYSKAKAQTGENFTFKSLTEIKLALGHPRIDVLKMDIEGFEWELLAGLLASPDRDLPEQILFELHTEGSNPEFVPARVVAGKRKQAVDELFLRLYDRGYRVMHWELNDGDKHCAEFAVARVQAA
jgi:hypothetical protein